MKPIGKSPSYLIRNHYSYCFRMVVPRDLQKLVGKKEMRYSLKTGYLNDAKNKARLLAGQVQLLFQRLREGGSILKKLADDQIKKLVHQYIKDSIEGWDTGSINKWQDDSPPPYTDAKEFYDYVNFLDDIRFDLIANLNLGDFSMLSKQIQDLLEKNGINGIDTHLREYQKLCVEIHQAEIDLIPVQQKHMLRDSSYKNDLSEIFPELFQQTNKASSKVTMQTSEPLGKVVDAYYNENEPTWKIRSKPEIQRALDHLLNYFGGNIQIHTIDYSDMREYKEFLQTEEFRPGKTRAISTINDKYLIWVIGLFNYAEKNNYIKKNPAVGITIKDRKKKKAHQLKDSFTKKDLEKLFCNSKEYRENKRMKVHHFWVPIIALFTGMRREEICQLYVSDLKEVEGIWYFDINEDKPDKSVKTSEQRSVPLHDFLVNGLNFIEYVKNLPDQEGRLFPDLKRINNSYGHSIGNWFGKFLKRNEITGKKSFHSFRHTLKTHLAEKDVQDSINDILTGHSVKGEFSRYVKPSVRMLYEKAVKKIDYGIDLSHLKQSRFVSS